mmetsp:Transcript_6165/g.7483  ORF Transcript_6165/g.7483 Transcript_6165/m.7483 type:complete len:140 (+) Transcript_6165:210-629(+)
MFTGNQFIIFFEIFKMQNDISLNIQYKYERGDKRAYETDSIALNFALGFLRSGEINTLPFHFRATILIAMCHSETLQVQQELGEYISSHHFSAYETSYSLVSKALKDIQKNHEERIKQFERFPERNHILGRQSTQKEQA